MKRMIYVSAARPNVDTAMLTQIAKTSVANNTRNGLTGILVWVNDAFLQVLEGPENALTSTVERIKRDPRHKGIARLAYGPITKRMFPDWAMGHHAISVEKLPESLLPKPDVDSVFKQLTAAPDVELKLFLKNFYAINNSN